MLPVGVYEEIVPVELRANADHDDILRRAFICVCEANSNEAPSLSYQLNPTRVQTFRVWLRAFFQQVDKKEDAISRFAFICENVAAICGNKAVRWWRKRVASSPSPDRQLFESTYASLAELHQVRLDNLRRGMRRSLESGLSSNAFFAAYLDNKQADIQLLEVVEHKAKRGEDVKASATLCVPTPKEPDGYSLRSKYAKYAKRTLEEYAQFNWGHAASEYNEQAAKRRREATELAETTGEAE
eukprot:TRINITY_DN13742_c0_g1_i1.p1 TRINITY_DN13742_c0_g1~~TRINITY_DN13742_c0_g1_i1.p1  ORF type:complete len:242 (-),score=43.81 TRINITY_DN13742_c0_g1_i1:58-783(-)